MLQAFGLEAAMKTLRAVVFNFDIIETNIAISKIRCVLCENG